MIKYIFGLALIGLTSCIYNNQHAKFLPIDPSELIFKKGDCLSFQADSINKGVAIVIDYSKDEGGLWYGLCFTNYFDSIQPTIPHILDKKIFGRKIKNSLDKNGFNVGLDFEFVNDSCIKFNNAKIKIVGNLNLNYDKIKMGSDGATNGYSDMIHSFRNGLDRRLKPPDDYRDHIRKLDNFRPEEYFPLKDFLIDN